MPAVGAEALELEGWECSGRPPSSNQARVCGVDAGVSPAGARRSAYVGGPRRGGRRPVHSLQRRSAQVRHCFGGEAPGGRASHEEDGSAAERVACHIRESVLGLEGMPGDIPPPVV